jgi:hypothetical protein
MSNDISKRGGHDQPKEALQAMGGDAQAVEARRRQRGSNAK